MAWEIQDPADRFLDWERLQWEREEGPRPEKEHDDYPERWELEYDE